MGVIITGDTAEPTKTLEGEEVTVPLPAEPPSEPPPSEPEE